MYLGKTYIGQDLKDQIQNKIFNFQNLDEQVTLLSAFSTLVNFKSILKSFFIYHFNYFIHSYILNFNLPFLFLSFYNYLWIIFGSEKVLKKEKNDFLIFKLCLILKK